jgi:hypothetical protein
VTNLYSYVLINKTADPLSLQLRILNEGGTVQMVGQDDHIRIARYGKSEGAFFVAMPLDRLQGRKTPLRFELVAGDKVVDRIKTNFMGPGK